MARLASRFISILLGGSAVSQGALRTSRRRGALVGAALEDVLQDRDGREGVGPPGIKGEMRDHLRRLCAREAVIHSPAEVAGELRQLAGRDQGTNGDQAPVSRCKARTQ